MNSLETTFTHLCSQPITRIVAYTEHALHSQYCDLIGQMVKIIAGYTGRKQEVYI